MADTMTNSSPTYLIPEGEVRRRLGNISRMTLWRRLQQDEDFPRPKIINGRRYWTDDLVEQYVAALPEG